MILPILKEKKSLQDKGSFGIGRGTSREHLRKVENKHNFTRRIKIEPVEYAEIKHAY